MDQESYIMLYPQSSNIEVITKMRINIQNIQLPEPKIHKLIKTAWDSHSMISQESIAVGQNSTALSTSRKNSFQIENCTSHKTDFLQPLSTSFCLNSCCSDSPSTELDDVLSEMPSNQSVIETNTDEESDVVSEVWEISSICTETVIHSISKFLLKSHSTSHRRKVIKYLFIQPMQPEFSEENVEKNNEIDIRGLMQCFEQIDRRREYREKDGQMISMGGDAASFARPSFSGSQSWHQQCQQGAAKLRGQGSTGSCCSSKRRQQKLLQKQLSIIREEELNNDNNNNNSNSNNSNKIDSYGCSTNQCRKTISNITPTMMSEELLHHEQPPYPQHLQDLPPNSTVSHINYQTFQELSSSKPPVVSRDQMICFSFLLLDRRVNEQALVKAQNFLKKFDALESGYEAILTMVQETYRMLMLPEDVLAQFTSVLTPQQKKVQAFNAYEKLNISNNRHPLANKAAQKIKKFFGY